MSFLIELCAAAVQYLARRPAKPTDPASPVRSDRSAGRADPVSVKRSYFLRYQGGSIRERKITVLGVRPDASAVTHIRAFCHERSAIRTFRVDRIDSAIDLQTGEVLTPRQFCAAITGKPTLPAEGGAAGLVQSLAVAALRAAARKRRGG